MEIYLKIIDSTIWPIVTITFMLMFRTDVKNMISKVNKFKYNGLEAIFGDTLSKVEESSKELPNKNLDQNIADREVYNYKYESLVELSKVSPRAAIFESWRELETATIDLVNKFEYNPNEVQVSKAFRGILYDNNYPSTIYKDYKDLRLLRNKAIHAEEFEINQIESERYIRMTLDIAIFVKNIQNKKIVTKIDMTKL